MQPGPLLLDSATPAQPASVLTPKAASAYLRERYGVLTHPSWLSMQYGGGAGQEAVCDGFELGELDRWGLLEAASALRSPMEVAGVGDAPAPACGPATGTLPRTAGRTSRPRDPLKKEKAAAGAWKAWVKGGARDGHLPAEARDDLIEDRLRGLRARWREDADLAGREGRPVPPEPGTRNALRALQAEERGRAEDWEVAIREALGVPGRALLAATVQPPATFARGDANEARVTAYALRVVGRDARQSLRRQGVTLAWHGHVLAPDRAGRAIMHVLWVAAAGDLRPAEHALRAEAGKVLLGGVQLDLGLGLVTVVDPASLEGTRRRGGGSIVAEVLGASWPAGAASDAIDRRAWARVFAVGVTVQAARVDAGAAGAAP